jgi:hypothetical protein
MSKKIILSVTLCFALNASVITHAFADEYVISGNGSGSNNQIQTTTSQNTTVEQSNNAEVTNNVNNSADTGNNQTNNNNGDTNIETGNISSNTQVNNDNINTNFAQNNPCCNGTENKYVIDGNGAGSKNSIVSELNTTIVSTQTNNAKITNNITVNANTGKNEANNNNGNVTIKTGNISSIITVNNQNINNSVQKLSGSIPTVNVFVKDNGAKSENNISLLINKNINSNVTNNANILNNIFSYLNTGRNKANGNNGDVFIETGDLLSQININNSANKSFTVVNDCGCEIPNHEKPTPTPTVPPSPSPKPGDGGNGHSDPSNGSVAGASASSGGGGETLPATGSYFLFLITIANLIMFFLGWYLRFRSGIAPGKAS